VQPKVHASPFLEEPASGVDDLLPSGDSTTPNLPVNRSRGRGWGRKRWAILGLGVLFSVALPILAFQGVNLSRSWELALTCDGRLLSLAGAVFLGIIGLRAWRWRCLLAAQQPVPYRSCLSAFCVGYLANNLLPFHMGDLVRAGTIQKMEGTSGARALGTVAVERVLDILTLVLFLGLYLVLVTPREHRTELMTAGWLGLAGGMVLSLALVVGHCRRLWLQRMAYRSVAWFSPALGEKLSGISGRFLEGLQVCVSPRRVLRLALMSVGIWGVLVGYFYVVGQAFGLPLSPADYLVVVFTTALGAIIPAAPGSVGTFHGFARLGLFLAGVASGEAALAFAAVMHALEWFLITLSGLYFLGRDRLSLLAAAPRRGDDAPPQPSCLEPEPAPDAQPV
jgi:uncharacterized protein (TIRG00374 family)